MLTTHQGLHFLGNLALGHPCINLGRGDEAMPQHLAHRLYRKSVLQTDGRGKGVPCGVRGRLSMRWQSCLNTYLLNSSIEITVAGKLSKEKPLPSSVAHNGEYFLGNGQQRDNTSVLCLCSAEGDISASITERIDIIHSEFLQIGECQPRETSQEENKSAMVICRAVRTVSQEFCRSSAVSALRS